VEFLTGTMDKDLDTQLRDEAVMDMQSFE